MRKQQILFTILSCMASLTAMAQTQHFEAQVGDFTMLNVLDNINVVYCSDAERAGTIAFDATQAVADGLMFNNNTRGKLTVQVSADLPGTTQLPTVYVYSTLLSSVENAGDSTLILRQVKPLKGLKAVLSDNGQIHVDDVQVNELNLSLITGKGVIRAGGRCKKLVIKVLGKGTVDALEVQAGEVYCRMMGTGTIDCQADGVELTVRGSGTGRVNYLGTPSKINVRKLGPLKVSALDS